AGVSVTGGVVTVDDNIGGATTGVAVTGGQGALQNTPLTGNATGVSVTGPGSLTVNSGNTIDGGTTGLAISGATAGLGVGSSSDSTNSLNHMGHSLTRR